MKTINYLFLMTLKEMVLILLLIPLTSKAATQSTYEGELYYDGMHCKYFSNGTATLVDYDGKDDSLYIPEYVCKGHKPYKLINIQDYAFKNASYLRTISADFIESMGDYALAGLTNLSYACFYSLQNLSPTHFSDCPALEWLYIQKVSSIPDKCFINNPLLWNIFIARNEPPRLCGPNCFNEILYEATALYVPDKYEAAYHASEGWNKFENIIGDWQIFSKIPTPQPTPPPFPAIEFINNLEYTLYEDGTAQLNEQLLTLDKDITIPASVNFNGDWYEVTHIATHALYEKPEIESLRLKCKRPTFGRDCINDLPNVKYLYYDIEGPADNFDYSELNLFYNLWSLESYEFGPNVSTLLPYLFQYSPFESIVIPDYVKEISHHCFDSCYHLKEVTLGTGLKKIGHSAFSVCRELQTLYYNCIDCDVSDNEWDTEYPPFGEQTYLTKLVVGPQVRTISERVFKSAYYLYDIQTKPVTPPSCKGTCFLKPVKEDADLFVPVGSLNLYKNAPEWKDFVYIQEKEFGNSSGGSQENPTFPAVVSIDGLEYTLYENQTAQFDKQLNLTFKTVTIPAYVTYGGRKYEVIHIADYALKSQNQVEELRLECISPSIGKNVFAEMPELKKVYYNFEHPLTESEYDYTGSMYQYPPFIGSSSLETIEIGPRAKVLFPFMFKSVAIETINIPEGVEVIQQNCFASCGNLKEVTLSSTIKEIQVAAFGDCNKLETINYNCVKCTVPAGGWINSYPPLGDRTPLLVNLNIGEEVENIPIRLFNKVSTFKEIKVAKTTPPSCDSGCFSTTVLNNATLLVPHSTSDIYRVAEVWKDFKSIQEMEDQGLRFPIVAIIDGLEYTLFEDLTAHLNVQNHILSDKITIPEKVCYRTLTFTITHFAEGALAAHDEVESLVLECDSPTMEGHVFANMSGLKHVIYNMRSVDENYHYDYTIWRRPAFEGCSIETIEIGPRTEDIIPYFFKMAGGVRRIVIPSNIKTIRTDAFASMPDLEEFTISEGVGQVGNLLTGDSPKFTTVNYLAENCKVAYDYLTNSYPPFGYKSPSLTKLNIGPNVDFINSKMFYRCETFDTIRVEAVEPPVCETVSNFTSTVKQKAILLVPAESIELYLNAPVWEDFLNIKALDDPLTFPIVTVIDKIEYTLYETMEATVNRQPFQLPAEVVIPPTVTYSNMTFEVTHIADKALNGHGEVKSIQIECVSPSIGRNIFSNMSSLESIYYDCERPREGYKYTIMWNNPPYTDTENVKKVEIGPNARVLIPYMFGGLHGYESIDVPTTVEVIFNDCFGSCSDLKSVTLGEGIQEISYAAFGNCEALETVVFNCANAIVTDSHLTSSYPPFGDRTPLFHNLVIGENVTFIHSMMFGKASTITDITVKATTPPSCQDARSFSSTVKSECMLHVPAGTLDLYRNAPVWNEFLHIVEDTDGVTSAVTKCPEVEIYNLNGIRTAHPDNGINIVKRKNLTTKVYIR